MVGQGILQSYADNVRFVTPFQWICWLSENKAGKDLLFCCREINLHDKRSWLQIERLYRCMKLYHTIFMNCFRFVVVPVIFSGSVCITVALYLTCNLFTLRSLWQRWQPCLHYSGSVLSPWLQRGQVMTCWESFSEELRVTSTDWNQLRRRNWWDVLKPCSLCAWKWESSRNSQWKSRWASWMKYWISLFCFRHFSTKKTSVGHYE